MVSGFLGRVGHLTFVCFPASCKYPWHGTVVALPIRTTGEPSTGDGIPDRDNLDGAQTWDDGVDDHTPGQIVRVKEHPAVPMTVDDALYEMELVGHDFFLFHDKETDKASVVYRRHAFDYGLIRLT